MAPSLRLPRLLALAALIRTGLCDDGPDNSHTSGPLVQHIAGCASEVALKFQPGTLTAALQPHLGCYTKLFVVNTQLTRVASFGFRQGQLLQRCCY